MNITIKNLDNFTLQQIFDKVVGHLLAQKAVATEVRESIEFCRYRTAEGLECAVGCLIPADLYKPEMEEQSVEDLAEKNFIPMPAEHRKLWLLNELQWAHDSAKGYKSEKELLKTWHYSFERVAIKFGLRYGKTKE